MRLKGEGSIWKRKDGRYQARLSLPAGPDGKRVGQDFYGHTREEVLGKLEKARVAKRRSKVAARGGGRVTVGDLVAEWLASLELPGSKAGQLTVAQYESEARTRVTKYLGKLPVTKLDDDRLTSWQDALLKAGYAPRSVMKARTVISAVILLARRKGLLFANPLELVPPPSASKPKKRAITGEEAGRFLRAIRGHPLEALFLTDLLIGARRGELLGLTWSDVDFDANTLYIGKQLQRVRKRGLQVLEPKSTAGERLLPIPEFLTERLHSLRSEQVARGISMSPPFLVFVSDHGKPIAPDTYNIKFRELVEAAGLAPLTPHELRHSVSTVLIALGVPAPVVAQYLGHADASVALRWYTHTVPDALRDAAARMNEYVRRLTDEHGENGLSVKHVSQALVLNSIRDLSQS